MGTAQGKSGIIDSVSANLEKFLAYNQIKKKNLYDSIGDSSVINLLELIPFLLHTNTASLPGHVAAAGVPCGIKDYTPSSLVMDLVRTKFPDVQTSPSPHAKPFVQMLALMGSGGTIAYTKESDFDFWICYHEAHYAQDLIDHFRRKCREIEHWIFDTYNREVHFYLNEIAHVKKNIFAKDEENFAGSSIGALLKEEFLRSSIVLQGGIPFWWMVSGGFDDAVYEQWLAAVKGSEYEDRFIDLGNLNLISQEDFLPAALFQILKSLGSPFKSIIKLGLLERYLYSGEGDPFISTTVKKRVHEGRYASEDIDAYVIMFNQVHDYYKTVPQSNEVVEILKMAFYLKVEPKLYNVLKGGGGAVLTEKSRVMLQYVKDWGWSEKKIWQMDDFLNWGIDSVNKLLNSTKKFILNGYKKILGSIEGKTVRHRFTAEDLQAITRKIYSHFLVAGNKIDNTLSFKSYPPEKLLKIEYVREKTGRDYWILSKRLIIKDNPAKIILYKENSLLGLSIWISLNGLFLKDFTRLEIDPGLHTADPNAIRELIMEASSNFSYKKVELQNHYFMQDPFPIMSLIVFNPYSKYAKAMEEIYFLYHNSWGETKFELFKSAVDLPRILQRILNAGLTTHYDYRDAVNVLCLSPYRSTKEFHAFRQLVPDLYCFFSDAKPDVVKRYVTSFANQFVVFFSRSKGNSVSVETAFCDNDIKLYYALSFNAGLRNEITLDGAVPDLALLQSILNNRKEGIVQIFYMEVKKFAYYFVIDEQGSINFYRKDGAVLLEYLAHLYVFALDAVKQVTDFNEQSALCSNKKRIEVYQVRREESNAITVAELNPENSSKISELRRKIVPLTMEISAQKGGQVLYNFSLGGAAMSPPYPRDNLSALGDALYAGVSAIRGMKYYIDGISMAKFPSKNHRKFTSFAFTEKSRIELVLEKVMAVRSAQSHR